MNSDTRPDRFETRLLAAILDDFPNLSSAEARDGRNCESSVSTGSGGSRRHRRLVLGAVGVAAAVAASVAGVVIAGGHAVPVRPSVPAHLSVKYVVDHVKSAVTATVNRDIQYELGHAPNSQTGVPENTATWVYGDSAREVSLSQVLGAGGRPVLGYLMTITRHKTVTITINYRSRVWSTATYPWGSATPANTPGPRPETISQAAGALRAAVKAGSMTNAGLARVDGQLAIHLVQGSMKAGAINMWVNPATYLPIRTISTAPGQSLTGSGAIREDYRWLPDSSANMRLLTPAGAIPAGFTHVSNAGTGN